MFNRRLFFRVLNFFMFYIGWGFCLTGAVSGRPLFGPAIVLLFLLLHLIQERFKLVDIVMIVTLSLFGTALDTIYLNLGMIDYKAGYATIPWIAPIWVTAIWALFSISVNHSLVWLRLNLVLASLFGFGGGVLSYFAAVRVGAATFYPSVLFVLTVVGLSWSLIMPLIVLYGEWIERKLIR